MRRTSQMAILFAVLLTGAVVLAPHAAQAQSTHHTITVMTRNVDEGTDFGYILAAVAGQMTFSDAVTATYSEVLASHICGRAEQIADEIAASLPDLVSLQEVARWTGPIPSSCAGSPATTTLDMETALLERLAADGARYVVVKEEDEFDSSGIAALLPPGLSFLDRDVLLARVRPKGQLSLSNAMSAHYSTLLPLPLAPGLSVPVERGWISVDATLRGRTVRVIATHLESFFEPVQVAQAMELVAGPANTILPVILAGDLNSGPGSVQITAYNLLTTSGGLTDTWSVTNPGNPGFTDPFYIEDQPPPGPATVPATPSERIDLVLVRGELVPLSDVQVGTASPHPSDHAGVVATVFIPPDLPGSD